ncbi:MAG: protein kinase [Candidatus Eisenbacteria bacterium]|uniref:Protein kinase n=1 Tax=Eiseniibacteriota bacterium TaxID=2212470 RepID=A0A7Y2H1L0_UNCEI|nr:protein kinase [Candidatus Eisenbacteria bacterium]
MKDLTHYSIIDKLGEGGMGVVYRAQDERLKREVAIKVLPESFVADPERLARFEREAQVLASLHHPNVASIFGLEQDGETRFLALELVPGEDLSHYLARGPFPVDEAVTIATQIATAIEAAHEVGIVHRDLKPGNVMLTPDGVAKVLDFGLAKATESDDNQSSLNLSNSPTFTGLMTEANVIIGTAAYMAPEQARGKKVDKRADIWSFGVILFEMLTGRQLFAGETVSDTLASVLKNEIPYDDLPAETPKHVRMLLERCLTRDPQTRLRDIGEARIVLSTGDDIGLPETESDGQRSGIKPLMAALTGLVALAAGLGLGVFFFGNDTANTEVPDPRHFTIDAGPGPDAPSAPAISPDGKRIAYIRNGSIWVRDLNRVEPRHLQQTSDALCVFWSPDGDRIGYLTSSEIVAVDPNGGSPRVLGNAGAHVSVSAGAGGIWTREHGILFSRGDSHVFRISDRGGEFSVFAEVDTTVDIDLHEPGFLPDGSLIYVPHRNAGGPNMLELLHKGERTEILPLGDNRIYRPTWSSTGHLLYETHDGNPGVWALPFDLGSHRATGEPALVYPNATFPSVAEDGTLTMLVGGGAGKLQLVEADRTGRMIRTIGEPHAYDYVLDLSPDARRISLLRETDGDFQVWVIDITRGTETRLTFSDGNKNDPRWTGDGNFIAYHVGAGSDRVSMLHRVDGSAEPESMYVGAYGVTSVPGSTDMVVTSDPDLNIYLAPRERDAKMTLLAKDENWQYGGFVSPDRRYLAYTSRETGEDQVFLKRFPDGSGKWQVSVRGGAWPQWSADSQNIVFCNREEVYSVRVEGEESPVLGVPELLFTREPLGFELRLGLHPRFSMTGDGERFYFYQSPKGTGQGPSGIVLLEGWQQEIELE